MHSLYWIHLNHHTDPMSEGYIGVTFSPEKRFLHHKKVQRVPSDSILSILHTGTRKHCFELELKYRPERGIGWNSAVGGSHGWRYGFKHSEKTKKKLKLAWTKKRKIQHSKRLSATAKDRIGIPHPKQSISIAGKNNGMYGKKHSLKSRTLMSKKQKGRIANNKIEYYCIFCHAHVSPSNLDRHGPGKSVCK